MADVSPAARQGAPAARPWFGLLVAAGVLLLLIAAPLLPPGWREVPAALRLPLSDWIEGGMNWLARDAAIGGLAFSDVTRALAAAAQWPIEALQVLLAEGWVHGAGFNKVQLVPPLSWLGITLATALLAWRISGRGLAVMTLVAGLYLALFGLWTSAMTTLASVLICVAAALVLGLAIGIRAHRSPGMEPAVRAVMNVMQTVPIFSYLLPTLLLFGYGPSAALFATVVYALPPMVHATVLALRSVPPETLELARMTGCSRRQTLW